MELDASWEGEICLAFWMVSTRVSKSAWIKLSNSVSTVFSSSSISFMTSNDEDRFCGKSRWCCYVYALYTIVVYVVGGVCAPSTDCWDNKYVVDDTVTT